MELTLEIACSNDHSHHSNSQDHVCDIQVKNEPEGWVKRTSFDHLEESGTAIHRKEYGIRIKTRAGGGFFFPNLTTIVLYLSSAMVLMNIPMGLVTFVAVNFPGLLSRVYKEALHEHFDLRL